MKITYMINPILWLLIVLFNVFITKEVPEIISSVGAFLVVICFEFQIYNLEKRLEEVTR